MGDELMKRAPEIVLALKIHADAGDQCGGCCYDDGKSLDCGARLTADAAEWIEQLSAQLAALQAENTELRTTLSRVEAERDEYRALGTVEELTRGAALVKAQEEGLLLKMPCKPGAELFGHCHIRGADPISHSYFYPPYVPTLGVDAWLTRAEAEAATRKGEE